MPLRAAFLDRDGVINQRPAEHDYVRHPDDLVLLPKVVDAIELLRAVDFTCIVVSNQRGVSRGLSSRRTLTEIEDKIRGAGADIARFYYCPHDIADACDCRK